MKSSSNRKPLMPTTYLLIAILSMISMRFILPSIRLFPAAWNLLGIPLLVLGGVISTLAEKQFHKVKTTVKPFQPTTILVTDGLFHYSRNPMYLGFVLALFGVGVTLGSVAPFLIIPLFAFGIQVKFIKSEEAKLATTFGRDWFDYTRKTRRWI